MTDHHIIDADESEIEHLPSTEVASLGIMAKAELDSAILTARANPRQIKKVINNITSLVTLDEETAAECIYALPRGGKPIRGPSVRLAEIVAQQWGNNRVEAEVIEIDRVNKVIRARGTFHDLESNSAVRAPATRRISDKRGRLFNDDMIAVATSAVCSIARRNAIFAGVPKFAYRKAYEAAEQVIAGDIKTLAERREKAVKAFAAFGVKPEQIFAILGVNSIEDISLDNVISLAAMYAAIKNGEATVEELFDPRKTGSTHEVVANPLKDIPDENGEIPMDYKAVGAWARGQGVPRDRPPGELRSTDRAADLAQWQAGWDSVG